MELHGSTISSIISSILIIVAYRWIRRQLISVSERIDQALTHKEVFHVRLSERRKKSLLLPVLFAALNMQINSLPDAVPDKKM